MATEQHTPTLQQQIADFQSKRNAPAPIKEAFAKGTQDLIASGIANKSVKQGDRASDFALPNVNGETVQLSQLLAKGPVVLIFYRGGWCPYCNLALRAYQAILPEIRAGWCYAGGRFPSDTRQLALCKRENGPELPCFE